MSRVNRLLQMSLAEMVPSAINDPRIAKVTLMTVTRVRASPDLGSAKILVAIKGEDDDVKAAMLALKGASGFLRSELGRRVDLRHIPQLRFILDTTAVEAANIEQILQELKEERRDGDAED